MTSLYLSGTAPRGCGDHQPVSVIEAFGRTPVPGHWSGLYGNASTREGLKRLMRGAEQPVSVYRITCEVPGGLTTSMGREEIESFGYLNVRYANAALKNELEAAWSRVTGLEDGEQAMTHHPDVVVEVLKQIDAPPMSLVIHPFEVPGENLMLSVATVLNNDAVSGYRSRDRGLTLHLETLASAPL